MKSVERWQTNKQTHKHTYGVKTEETFFNHHFFLFYFYLSYTLHVKKAVSKKLDQYSKPAADILTEKSKCNPVLTYGRNLEIHDIS